MRKKGAPEDIRVKQVLHITGGDCSGSNLGRSGVPGDVFVWHDILYDGPRKLGWPDDGAFRDRARFIERATGGGLSRELVLETLKNQYRRLETSAEYERLVLWFDACLFDQAMLVHVLACLKFLKIQNVDLLCVDAFPGIVPFDGLGQLLPEQLASVYSKRQPVTAAQFHFAEQVDRAFALQDKTAFAKISVFSDAPLPWIPAAVKRWLQEQPDEETGLGRLEHLALEAIRSGRETPGEIFAFVSAKDAHPHFWGDTTLWAKINALTDRKPPLARIAGPGQRLPQWEGIADVHLFRVYPAAPAAKDF
ncbi:MAG: hypothetical protein ABII89_00705 [Candidatus Omnitrophota bacterium]